MAVFVSYEDVSAVEAYNNNHRLAIPHQALTKISRCLPQSLKFHLRDRIAKVLTVFFTNTSGWIISGYDWTQWRPEVLSQPYKATLLTKIPIPSSTDHPWLGDRDENSELAVFFDSPEKYILSCKACANFPLLRRDQIRFAFRRALTAFERSFKIMAEGDQSSFVSRLKTLVAMSPDKLSPNKRNQVKRILAYLVKSKVFPSRFDGWEKWKIEMLKTSDSLPKILTKARNRWAPEVCSTDSSDLNYSLYVNPLLAISLDGLDKATLANWIDYLGPVRFDFAIRHLQHTISKLSVEEHEKAAFILKIAESFVYKSAREKDLFESFVSSNIFFSSTLDLATLDEYKAIIDPLLTLLTDKEIESNGNQLVCFDPSEYSPIRKQQIARILACIVHSGKGTFLFEQKLWSCWRHELRKVAPPSSFDQERLNIIQFMYHIFLNNRTFPPLAKYSNKVTISGVTYSLSVSILRETIRRNFYVWDPRYCKLLDLMLEKSGPSLLKYYCENKNPLSLAITTQDLPKIEANLAVLAYVDVADFEGNKPIDFAVEHGTAVDIQRLLKSGIKLPNYILHADTLVSFATALAKLKPEAINWHTDFELEGVAIDKKSLLMALKYKQKMAGVAPAKS